MRATAPHTSGVNLYPVVCCSTAILQGSSLAFNSGLPQMRDTHAFWTWFDLEAGPKLGAREVAFRKAFAYLDTLQRTGPVTIVETGCTRIAGNWAGDGQSSVLFDRYLSHCPAGSEAHAVDIDPNATAQCRQLVSNRVHVHTGDSVPVLRQIARTLADAGRTIDLLYLDSFDVDWKNTTPSSAHHLKELVSIVGSLRSDTLVMVDDCPAQARMVGTEPGNYSLISQPEIGGKGGFVAEYAAQVGATLLFSHYQAAWTHFV